MPSGARKWQRRAAWARRGKRRSRKSAGAPDHSPRAFKHQRDAELSDIPSFVRFSVYGLTRQIDVILVMGIVSLRNTVKREHCWVVTHFAFLGSKSGKLGPAMRL